MSTPNPTYPATLAASPGGDFTIHRFFLPIRLNDEEMWALIDTGANISILPKEIADLVLTRYQAPINDGEYKLAGMVGVPYESYKLDFEVLGHIPGTMGELDIMPYMDQYQTEIFLRDVEFQVPKFTWSEIASRLESDSPVSIHGSELSYVVLGLYGVLDQMTLSFVGDNSVTVGPIEAR